MKGDLVVVIQVPVSELQDFYLWAAADTYVAKAEKATIVELPGSKVYRRERDGLSYIDTYWTSGPYSGGFTLLLAYDTKLVCDVPQWMMQYRGWCKDDDREVLDFLKRALQANYANGVFHLGRGPARYCEEEPRSEGPRALNNPLIYRCTPNMMGPINVSFEYFSGAERIYRYPDLVRDVFWHEMSGLLLRDEYREQQPWLR